MLERNFTGWGEKINSLENKLQRCEYLKPLIRNVNRKPTKITKLGHKKWRLLN